MTQNSLSGTGFAKIPRTSCIVAPEKWKATITFGSGNSLRMRRVFGRIRVKFLQAIFVHGFRRNRHFVICLGMGYVKALAIDGGFGVNSGTGVLIDSQF